jgi:hypothetical protein
MKNVTIIGHPFLQPRMAMSRGMMAEPMIEGPAMADRPLEVRGLLDQKKVDGRSMRERPEKRIPPKLVQVLG